MLVTCSKHLMSLREFLHSANADWRFPLKSEPRSFHRINQTCNVCYQAVLTTLYTSCLSYLGANKTSDCVKYNLLCAGAPPPCCGPVFTTRYPPPPLASSLVVGQGPRSANAASPHTALRLSFYSCWSKQSELLSLCPYFWGIVPMETLSPLISHWCVLVSYRIKGPTNDINEHLTIVIIIWMLNVLAMKTHAIVHVALFLYFIFLNSISTNLRPDSGVFLFPHLALFHRKAVLAPKLTWEQCGIQHYLNEMFSHLNSPLISYHQGGSANAGAP